MYTMKHMMQWQVNKGQRTEQKLIIYKTAMNTKWNPYFCFQIYKSITEENQSYLFMGHSASFYPIWKIRTILEIRHGANKKHEMFGIFGTQIFNLIYVSDISQSIMKISGWNKDQIKGLKNFFPNLLKTSMWISEKRIMTPL